MSHQNKKSQDLERNEMVVAIIRVKDNSVVDDD